VGRREEPGGSGVGVVTNCAVGHTNPVRTYEVVSRSISHRAADVSQYIRRGFTVSCHQPPHSRTSAYEAHLHLVCPYRVPSIYC
jgi:hypothetical protein